MRQVTSAAAGLALLLGSMLNSAPVCAQANRTYVSAQGDDANTCSSQIAPCRTFQAAHDNTNSGGEIMVLNGAGYGPVNITKAITISNEGVGEAGMLASGIKINAGTSDIVTLRGLTLNGVTRTGYGIEFVSGGTLNVENCFIHGYDTGINAHPNQPTAVAFNISDTIVSDTVDGAFFGPISTGFVNVALKRVQISGSTEGIVFRARSTGDAFHATVIDSLLSNNRDFGLVGSSTGEAATVAVTNSQAVNNGTGLGDLGTNMAMVIGGNTVSGNGTAYFSSVGALKSLGNNYISGNGDDGGALTAVATK